MDIESKYKYYDLKVDITSLETWKEVVKSVENANYHGIAINRNFSSKMPEIDPLPEWTSNTTLRIYDRVTILLDNPSINFGLGSNSQTAKNVDIIAVTPTTEKLFHLACTQLEIDIISLPLDTKLPFYLKYSTMNAAIQRGIYFELCFKSALTDSTARRNAFYNASQIITISRGKNILVTSGAISAMDVRSPYDFMNLSTCLGLSLKESAHVVSKNAYHILCHAATRKHTYRGVASIVQRHDGSRNNNPLHEDFIAL